MANLSATDARRGFFEIVKGAAERHEVYRIQHRKGSVVLLSESDYDSLIETLELLSLPGFRERLRASAEQVAAGDTLSLDEAFGPD
jgi:antitoxin YefM